jgi:SAM-dependent methyltransferase
MTLRFVTKQEYWDIEDVDTMAGVARPGVWHLKTVQDAVAYSYLHQMEGKAIGEIGGGRSRLLPQLAKVNECFNFEIFQGKDGGPDEEVEVAGVTNVKALVGQTEGVFPPARLDALFSVSVVEHIPTENLRSFFSDCLRLLRPGGRAVHLIDVYLTDDSPSDKRLQSRLAEYARPLHGEFSPEDAAHLLDPSDVAFSCSFATNPDNVMAMWNRAVPALRKQRERSQVVALLWVGSRPGNHAAARQGTRLGASRPDAAGAAGAHVVVE